jgi:uncharacterized protein (DUF58 family)
MFTRRFLLLMLAAAPLMALSGWVAPLVPVAWFYLAAALGLAAFDRWAARPADRFELRREHDRRLSLGAENLIRIHIRERSGRGAEVRLRDEPPDDFVVVGRGSSVVGRGSPVVGRGSPTEPLVGRVKGRRTLTLDYHVRPRRRGDYRFGDLNLRWTGPLGLVVRQARYPAAAAVKVYPNLIGIRKYDLLLRRNRLHELGLRNARIFGEGTEFHRLREYLPDDEYRRINWKATARRAKPITMEYETERSQMVMALLDVGRMMGVPIMGGPVGEMAKLDYVVNAVLLFGYVAAAKGDKVGLLAFADQVRHYLAPRQGRGQFYRLLELLYGVQTTPVEPDYGRAINYLAARHKKRSLIVLFTDLTGGLGIESLVNHVATLRPRHLPLVVTISDPAVHAVAGARPVDSATVYQRAVAEKLLEERRVTLDTLERRGVLTLDVPAEKLTMAVINKYLELKARTML